MPGPGKLADDLLSDGAPVSAYCHDGVHGEGPGGRQAGTARLQNTDRPVGRQAAPARRQMR